MSLCTCTDPTPLKIGFIAGLTGRFADLGTSGRNGAMLAVELQNAQGGIRGRPVTLLIRDDEHDPLHARQVFGSLMGSAFKGQQGEIRFDAYGDANRTAYPAIVQGERYVSAEP